MPPNSDFVPPSTLGIKPPATRSQSQKLTVHVWLQDKQDTDGAEGLWRVNDGLYDLSQFVDIHPGGKDWLILTKGTDITEAFEVHHISEQPESVLKKYYVRDAETKRNAPFTFDDDGFYRTLKKEVRKHLKTIPKQPINTSNFLMDAMVVLLFLFATMAVYYWSFGIGVLAGMFLAWVTIAAHNYTHQKDNFRMYYLQFSLLQVREWRISHVLSHHLHTNTIDDLEISMLEPLLQYMPTGKSPAQKFGSCLIAPVLWITYFHTPLIKRLIRAVESEGKSLLLTDLTTFILPLFMFMFGRQSLLSTLAMWTFIICVGSVHFAFVGLHAAHHHPDIFHDGDTPRATENYDWGISQLDAVMDRQEINGSHFMVLTNFGDHCLHHLFPTLDHGVLEHLYPILNKVMEQFDVNLRIVSQWDTIVGGFQQLMRVQPNPNPPDLKKYSKKKLYTTITN